MIDRETAHRLIEEELSKPEYASTNLNVLERIGRWLHNFLDTLIGGALGLNSPWLLIVVVLALAAIVALVVWRVRRAGWRKAALPVVPLPVVSADPDPQFWRTRAGEAAAAGDLPTAVLDEARAVFAVLALGRHVPRDETLTAGELATRAGQRLPAHGAAIAEVAAVFNDLLFGDTGFSGTDGDARLSDLYTRFQRLDTSLAALAAPPASSPEPEQSAAIYRSAKVYKSTEVHESAGVHK